MKLHVITLASHELFVRDCQEKKMMEKKVKDEGRERGMQLVTFNGKKSSGR